MVPVRLLLVFVLCLPAYGAISAGAQWEVRTGGADTNGGFFVPGGTGTDWSQQDAAQYAVTDAVTAGTSTITSATANFGIDVENNGCYVAGGTGGITAAWYHVITRVNSTTITVDRSTGLTAGTGATLNCGGGLLTLQKAADKSVALNTVWVKSGTYTLTTTVTVQDGSTGMSHERWVGYQTVHGDRTGTRPLVTTATNSTVIFTVGNADYQFLNFNLSNTAGTRDNGIKANANYATLLLQDSSLDGFTNGVMMDGGAASNSIGFAAVNIEIKNCSNSAATVTYLGLHCFACYVHDNTKDGLVSNLTNQGASVSNSIFYKNGRYAFYSTNGSGELAVYNSFFHTNGTTFTGQPFPAAIVFASRQVALIANSIFYGGSAPYLGTGTNNAIEEAIGRDNAYDSAGIGATVFYTSSGDVSLSADPATNAAAGDFTLNSTAGGGAALKGVGFPGAIIGTTGTTPTANIGPFQTSGAGGGQKSCVGVR